MKRFKNHPHKINVILAVFKSGEKLKNKEIFERVCNKGYKITDIHLRLFIYHNMLYKYIKKEMIKGVNYYSLINKL